MDKDYWLGRWARRETGWHQSEVEPSLVRWMASAPPSRVFVPLCGKSLDLKWLADHGHAVVGCELSLAACEEFFREHTLPFQIERVRDFTIFRGEKITIYGGDIFSLTPNDLGSIDRLYDRAALIALPPSLRERYANHLLGLLAGSIRAPFEFLQIVLERTPADDTGPPFSVPPSAVAAYYGSRFQVELLSRNSVEAKAPPGSTTEECVLLLQPKT